MPNSSEQVITEPFALGHLICVTPLCLEIVILTSIKEVHIFAGVFFLFICLQNNSHIVDTF